MSGGWKAWLCTPPKNRRNAWFIGVAIFVAPVIVALHFLNRLLRGHYRWDADSIGIYVLGFAIFIWPITLCLLGVGLRDYRQNISLFAWARSRFLRSLLWTLVTIYPVGLFSLAMVMDGVSGGNYWVTAFFLLHGYCILVLRASVVARAVAPVEVNPSSTPL